MYDFKSFLSRVQLGQIHDFYFQKAAGEKARDTIKEVDKDLIKNNPSIIIHFELHLNYLATVINIIVVVYKILLNRDGFLVLFSE